MNSQHPLQARFPKGSRVKPSEYSRQNHVNRKQLSGTVRGYGHDELLRIQLDGKIQPTSWHADFWEPETPSAPEATYAVPASKFPPQPLPKP